MAVLACASRTGEHGDLPWAERMCCVSRARSLRCGVRHAADKAMTIAADVCIYTNHNFTVEALKSEVPQEQPSKLLAGH